MYRTQRATIWKLGTGRAAPRQIEETSNRCGPQTALQAAKECWKSITPSVANVSSTCYTYYYLIVAAFQLTFNHQHHKPKMNFSLLLALLAAPALVSATLYPATSNTKGKCPSTYNCEATTVSEAIQAAECSHNTRTHGKQTFAVFVTDHEYDGIKGYPYGTCSAYTCKSPAKNKMKANKDCWTFFWSGNGTKIGYGTDCIKDPSTGACGCENSIDGKFIANKTDCV